MTRNARRTAIGLAAVGLLAVLGLRLATLLRAGFNWDEWTLFDGVARSLRDGVLRSGGRPGLAQILVMPLVDGCRDEIAVGRAARALWLAFTGAYVVGIFCLLREWLRGYPHRTHDAALGTALLALLPVFLEWSIQVRTDQIALAAGIWGGVALLRSERHAGLALAAGLAFGVGWIASQKLAYVGGLVALLAALRVLTRGRLAPQREPWRVVLTLAGFGTVLLCFRSLLMALFTLPETHAARQLVTPQLEDARAIVFPFYRSTIGYSQYRALLPTLLPHLALGLGLLGVSGALLRRRRADPRVLAAWAVLALGLAVALFHAAAFRYFWMTLGLFPAVAGALAVGPLRERLEALRPALLLPATALLWAAVAVPALASQLWLLRDTQSVQAQSLAFVHRNFPPDAEGFHPEGALFCRPPQAPGVYLSQRIFRTFEGPRRAQNIEGLIQRFRSQPVHFLVNSFRLNQFPLEVRRFWSEHYQPYREAVFVAGAQLDAQRAPGGVQPFDLIVTGPYRWLPQTARAAVQIDGQRLGPGEIRVLEAGPHEARLEPGASGVLVLSMRDAPGAAPLAFYAN